jgi:hypothetical protein
MSQINLETLRKNLEQNGFAVSHFATAAEAADYLDKKLDGKTVGHGGSMTLEEMGLLDRLESHATVYRHRPGGIPKEAATAQAYLCSVNGLAETGEIVNIDGTCNRVSSTMFGHEELYFVVGSNKLAADYDAALWRARNIASPLNAKRLGRKTPCAAKGDRCYNCNSPERICRGLSVLWKKPGGIGYAEVVLVDQELGY